MSTCEMITSFVSRGGLGDAWLAFLKIHGAAQIFSPTRWIHVASHKYQIDPITELMTLVPKIREAKCHLEYIDTDINTVAVDSNIKGLGEPFPEIKLGKFHSDAPYAVIQPFAGNPDSPRGFSPSAMFDVAEAAAQMKLDPVLIGSKYLFGQGFPAAAGLAGSVSNMTGKTSLRTSLQILKGASLFVGFRGFLAYAAMALRVPSIVIFDNENCAKRCVHHAWQNGTKILISTSKIIDAGEVIQLMRNA